MRVLPAVSAEAGAAAAAGVELEDCFLFLCALLVADSCLAEVNTLGPSSAAAAPSEYPQFVMCGNVCWLLYLYFSNVNFVQLESGKYHAEGGSTAAQQVQRSMRIICIIAKFSQYSFHPGQTSYCYTALARVTSLL